MSLNSCCLINDLIYKKEKLNRYNQQVRKSFIIGCCIILILQALLTSAEAEKIDRPITAWPLLYHTNGLQVAETDIFLPLLKYERKQDWTRYALRPFLFSTESDPSRDYRKTSFLWPLNIYKQESDTTTFHSVPFFWYKHSRYRRYNIIFPVYWKGEGSASSYFHLWPFLGINRKDETYREYSTLYPFFRYGSDLFTGDIDLHFPWPIANYHQKRESLSHRFLPFYWYKRGRVNPVDLFSPITGKKPLLILPRGFSLCGIPHTVRI